MRGNYLVWYHSHRHDVPLPSPAQDLYLYDGTAAGEADVVDRPELLRRLHGSSLLDRLDDDALDELADGARARQYARGEVIASARSEGDLHLLHRGRAALVLRGGDRGGNGGGDEVVLDVGEGELFGVMDHPDDGEGETAVVAVDDCAVVTVDAAVALPVVSRTPRLSEAIEQLAASRRRRIAHAVRRRAVARDAGAATGGDEPPTREPSRDHAAGGDGDSP